LQTAEPTATACAVHGSFLFEATAKGKRALCIATEPTGNVRKGT